jgi:iron complex transport system permease protein
MLAKVCSIGATWSPETEAVVLAIRLPRIASAVLVGAALSASGAAYQGLFRNPMVSPGILGVSSGASLGAAVAILLGLGTVGIQGSAFVGGLGAVALTWAMSSMVRGGSDPVLVTVLAGTIVSALLAALVALVKLVADPSNALPTITYWLMGSLASVGTNDVALAAVPIIGGLAVLLSLGFPLDILCFGDDEAKALGAEPARLRLVIIIAATLVTAASVAISGVIGLVGLVVPHLARMLVGPGHRRLIPAAALLGGAFLLAVDDVARSLFAIEVPLGILTSIIGAPFFLYLLQRGRGGWT